MRPARLSLAVFLGAAALLSGCSGASDTGLFDPGQTQGDQTGATGATAADAGASSGHAGAARDAGDGKRDAAPPPPPATFACGSGASCAGTTCCASQQFDGFQVTTTFACVASEGACRDDGQTAAAPIACHASSDCGAGFCCGAFDGTEYHGVACAASCEHPTDGSTADHIRFCDPARGNAECLAGETCGASQVLKGFYRCG